MSTEAANQSAFNILDLLKLDKFFAPKILLLLYWISLVFVLLAAAFTTFGGMVGMFSRYGSGLLGFAQMIGGLVFLVVGPLYLRLLFETMTVFFSINEKLHGIRENTKH